MVRVITQSYPNLANRRIDSLARINEDVVAPESHDDLFSRDQLPMVFRKQNQQFHGELFQLDAAARSTQFVGVQVQLKLIKVEDRGLHGAAPHI